MNAMLIISRIRCGFFSRGGDLADLTKAVSCAAECFAKHHNFTQLEADLTLALGNATKALSSPEQTPDDVFKKILEKAQETIKNLPSVNETTRHTIQTTLSTLSHDTVTKAPPQHGNR